MQERLPLLTPLQARQKVEDCADQSFSLQSKLRHPGLYDVVSGIAGNDFEEMPDVMNRDTFHDLRKARECDLVLTNQTLEKPVGIVFMLMTNALHAENALVGKYLLEFDNWLFELRKRTDRILDALCLEGPIHPVSASDRIVTGLRKLFLTTLALHEKSFAGSFNKVEWGFCNDFVLREGYFAPRKDDVVETPDVGGPNSTSLVAEGDASTEQARSTKLDPLDPRALEWEILDQMHTLTQKIAEVRMELEGMEHILQIRSAQTAMA